MLVFTLRTVWVFDTLDRSCLLEAFSLAFGIPHSVLSSHLTGYHYCVFLVFFCGFLLSTPTSNYLQSSLYAFFTPLVISSWRMLWILSICWWLSNYFLSWLLPLVPYIQLPACYWMELSSRQLNKFVKTKFLIVPLWTVSALSLPTALNSKPSLTVSQPRNLNSQH